MTWVREMAVGDAAAVSAVRVAGWRAAYAGVIPGAYLDAMSVERDAALREERFAAGRAAGLCDLVAVGADGQVVGWACCGPRDTPGAGPGAGEGELYALYVRPALLGRGVGRALLGAVHDEAAGRGWGALVLWVVEANARARRFYEAGGYRADGGAQDEEYEGVVVREVRYRRMTGPPPGGSGQPSDRARGCLSSRTAPTAPGTRARPTGR
ncbi:MULTISPECIES: GNAT family N-acetyltransferase [Streptomyces]|uniref:GNAT family N-acetyltransferase n=2 Tax=Streptomyces diastaticus group TaxID=2849069 RepID=A0ABX6RQH8_9ACTN|nr:MULTISPECIES: GNAT family N-acetyltransferase [Streptomyces]MDQ0293604.1 GNAT superfamily N-acetyltransferase [Streptomyces sp. DSM 41037]PJM81671.1 GNAT family N-acetyltransferase [Streptomyces sp. TSRI0384-2]QNE82885.1 GNAT family N-acetyltransferase [Streptomyces rutgersensis]